MQRIGRVSTHLCPRDSAATTTPHADHDMYGVSADVLTAAIVKGMRFLADNTTPNGQYTLGVDETHNNYKEIPLGYQAAGMPTEAVKCLEFAWNTFIKPQGPEGAVPPISLETENMIVYAPSWSVRSAVQHGRMDIAALLMPYILSFQGKGTYGGFYGGRNSAKEGSGVYCFDSSTVAIQACLWTGEKDAALRGGNYLLRLAELQPAGSDRWYWMLDSSGELVTDPTDHAPFGNGDFDFATGEQENFFLQRGKPDQYYYKTGLFVAMCTYLYDTFGDAAYLDAAKQCMEFSLACHEDVYSTMLGHKMIWGAAELFRVTREERYREYALRHAHALAKRQEPEGWYYYREFIKVPKQEFPGGAKFGMTSQLSTWMAYARDLCL